MGSLEQPRAGPESQLTAVKEELLWVKRHRLLLLVLTLGLEILLLVTIIAVIVFVILQSASDSLQLVVTSLVGLVSGIGGVLYRLRGWATFWPRQADRLLDRIEDLSTQRLNLCAIEDAQALAREGQIVADARFLIDQRNYRAEGSSGQLYLFKKSS